MKYIDAEKLKVLLSDLKENHKYYNGDFHDGVVFAAGVAKELIDSLQEEQESITERFARIVRGNLIGIDKEVQQKFENLYFEITGNKMYGGYKD